METIKITLQPQGEEQQASLIEPGLALMKSEKGWLIVHPPSGRFLTQQSLSFSQGKEACHLLALLFNWEDLPFENGVITDELLRRTVALGLAQILNFVERRTK